MTTGLHLTGHVIDKSHKDIDSTKLSPAAHKIYSRETVMNQNSSRIRHPRTTSCKNRQKRKKQDILATGNTRATAHLTRHYPFDISKYDTLMLSFGSWYDCRRPQQNMPICNILCFLLCLHLNKDQDNYPINFNKLLLKIQVDSTKTILTHSHTALD